METVMTRLRDRRTWWIGGLLIVVLGFALGSGWLTVAALLPLLVLLAPCLAMCALGLCMRRGSGGSSCQSKAGAPADTDPSVHTEAPSTKQP